jgi:HEAT repeat protein
MENKRSISVMILGILLRFCAVGHASIGYGQTDKVRELIDQFYLPNHTLQQAAIQASVEVGEPAIEPLIAVLKDPDPMVRGDAVDALEKIKDLRAVEPLIVVLKDPDYHVQVKAAYTLGASKTPERSNL